MTFLAHGIGGRSDLPVPLWLAAYGAALAVAMSFLMLLVFWKDPRLTGAAAGQPLPGWLQSTGDAPATRIALRTLGLALLAITLATAWFGTDTLANNPAPTWLYVWFWVGLVPASVLFGPVWRLLNPLRTIAAAISRLGVPTRELPVSVGYWPAVASLLIFVWIELVYRSAATPATVAWFVTAYALVHVTAGVVYGQRWFDRGDGFEVYSTLLGHLSPLGRRDDGRLALRNPLDSLDTVVPSPGLVTVVCVLLGSTGFDGLTRGLLWKDLVATYGTSTAGYLLLGTAGLLVSVAFVLVSYTAAVRSSRSLAPEYQDLPGRFTHSLVPIVFGYTVAHYFSFALYEGQGGLLLATDPFGRGWDLLGLAGQQIDYTVVSPQVVALIQVGAIVLGHILGVIAAHDRAVATYPPAKRTEGQYGLVLIMIAYTIGGITLVVGT
ncbi:MAG: hypothetical protein ACRDTM_11165 [Micromonosporaceae bacterium]